MTPERIKEIQRTYSYDGLADAVSELLLAVKTMAAERDTLKARLAVAINGIPNKPDWPDWNDQVDVSARYSKREAGQIIGTVPVGDQHP